MNFLTLVILLLGFSVSAKNITPLLSGPQFGTYSGTAHTTNSHLFFITQKNSNYLLWSYNAERIEPFKLITENPNTSGLRLIKSFNGGMLFLASSGEENTLWRTDGETSVQISDMDLRDQSHVFVGKESVYFTDHNYNLYKWSDNHLIDLETHVPRNLVLCQPNDQLTYLYSEQDQKAWLVVEENIQEVSFDFNFSEHDYPQFTNFNGTCYLSSNRRSVDNSVYELTPELPVKIFEPSVSNMSYVFAHDERLYAVGSSENSEVNDVIHKLSEDLQSIELSNYAPGSYYFDYAFSVGRHLTAAMTTGGFEAMIFGFLYTTDFYDIPIDLTLSQLRINGMSEIGDKTFVVNKSLYNVPDLQIVDEDLEIEKYDIPNQQISSIHSVKDSNSIYISTWDEGLQKSLFQLSDSPYINDQISGSWIEQSLTNQGLMIQLSQRKDGSQYVFLTLYTFMNGKPFWLAGMAPYQLADELEVKLWAYNGLNFLQNGAVPIQDPFGKLFLKLTTCQSLEVNLDTPGFQDTLSFSRMEDQTYEHLCNNIIPWTENKAQTQSLAIKRGISDIQLTFEEGSTKVVSESDEPIIGATINGSWIDPELQNQGIVARHGQRMDGSEYIFLTVFTFKAGEPFWLAGMAELTGKNTTMTIELAELEGLGYMQMDATATQEIVGDITLSFEDCDHMSAELTYNNQTHALNLQRMDDSKHKRYCLEPVTR